MMTDIQHAKTLLIEGKLVAIPTETVYGLGADAKNPSAIQKIYAAKRRPATNPLIIHLPNPDAMCDWALDIPKIAWKLAEAFWPGPLTLILKRHPDVPKIVTGGQETVALRIPNHPVTLELLNQFGGGIAAPSANRSGRLSPTTTEHVREELGDAVDYILEGGPCTIGIESTIVSLVGPAPVILRLGSLSAETVGSVLGLAPETLLPAVTNGHTTLETPGSSTSHYAPSKPLYLFEHETLFNIIVQLMQNNQSFSVLSFSEGLHAMLNPIVAAHSKWIAIAKEPKLFANQLYHQLRLLDKNESECILVEMPPNTSEWLAIRDRLKRASRPWA